MTGAVLAESTLDERLTAPSDRDIAAALQLDGEVFLLGAGGKIGRASARCVGLLEEVNFFLLR